MLRQRKSSVTTMLRQRKSSVTTMLRHPKSSIRPRYDSQSCQLRPCDDRLSSVQEVTDDSDDPTDDPNTFVVTEVTTLAKIFLLKRSFFSELPVLQFNCSTVAPPFVTKKSWFSSNFEDRQYLFSQQSEPNLGEILQIPRFESFPMVYHMNGLWHHLRGQHCVQSSSM